jgi:hypothetical protein
MNMLTGGTKDVKPQILAFAVTQSGADATTTQAQPLPVLRNFSSGNGSRAQLIEVLKVQFTMPLSAEVDSSSSVYLSTKNFGTTATNAADPSVFAHTRRQLIITTSGQSYFDLTQYVDLTDGNGNGVLIATDNIYLQLQSATTSLTNSCICRILYRMYGASVTEYVGIVQGQQ